MPWDADSSSSGNGGGNASGQQSSGVPKRSSDTSGSESKRSKTEDHSAETLEMDVVSASAACPLTCGPIVGVGVAECSATYTESTRGEFEDLMFVSSI